MANLFEAVFKGHVYDENPHTVAGELQTTGKFDIVDVEHQTIDDNGQPNGGTLNVYAGNELTDDQQKALHNHAVYHVRKIWQR
jgi:hypothetical protein